MSAPQYVPKPHPLSPRAYQSPPRRPGSWMANRPGDIVDEGQPRGGVLGNQGPDQGFALKLAKAEFEHVHLQSGEHAEDVIVGVVAVAMRRASLYARAPMIHDVRLAFEVFGFYDENPAAELVDWRVRNFAGLSHTAAHYLQARELANAVPEEVLRGTREEVAVSRRANWRAVLGH